VQQVEADQRLLPDLVRAQQQQALQAAGQAKKAVEQNAMMLQQKIAERTKLLSQLEQAKIGTLEVPDDYLVGRILAHDVADPKTGELLSVANDEIDDTLLVKFRKAGVASFGTLWVNDLDRGPYISNTLRSDSTRTQLEALVEIYRMMRPGEPPTKDAAQNLFHNLFFTFERYDLSGVGRMKFNRRVGRKEVTGESVLFDSKYFSAQNGEEAKRRLLGEKQPSLQFVTPDQLGALAVFLCSPAAAFVTGAALPVDGGATARCSTCCC